MTDTKNTLSDELLPCPFCEAPGKMIRTMGEWLFNRDENGKLCPPYYGPDWFRVVCTNNECYCSGRSYADEADATANWNRRASIPGGVGVEEIAKMVDPLAWSETYPNGYRTARKVALERAACILSALDLSPAKGEPVAWVGDYLKSDGTYDYFVMIGRGEQATSIHKHTIRGRAEYEAAEINHALTGSPKPEFDDYDLDGPYAAPSNPVISDEMVDESFAAHVMRLISKAEQMVGYADLTLPDAQVAWTKWRDERIHVLRLATAALSVKPQSGESE